MDINLTNPIFPNETKATAHMEADRWPDGVHLPVLRLAERPSHGGQDPSWHVPVQRLPGQVYGPHRNDF